MGIKSDFKQGIFYSAIGKYSNLFIQLGVTAILARLLVPEDFGIVAVINVFLTFFIMLADMGIGPAIIQKKNLSNSDANSIFNFSIIIAIVLAILFWLLATPISIFFSDNIYISIMRLLSVNVLITGLLIVPRSLLLKQKLFAKVNGFSILSNVISGIVGVALAFNDFGFYSLIIMDIVRNFVSFILFYYNVDVKLGTRIFLKPLKEIYEFSRNQFSFGFVHFFSRNLDRLLIGRFISADTLGFYNQAYTLSLHPTKLLSGVITPVIQPIMSDYQEDKKEIKRIYLKVTSLLATIGLPLTVFLFFSATEIIIFMLGEQWINSIPIFRILTLSVWVQLISSSFGAFLQVGNRTDLLLKSGILSAVLNVAGIAIAVLFGRAEYVAVAVTITFTINFIQANYFIMVIMIGAPLREFLKILIKPAITATLVGLAMLLFRGVLFNNSFLTLLMRGLVFIVAFLIGIKATGQMSEIKKSMKK